MYKQICSEVSVNSPGNPWSQFWRRKGRLRWEGFAEKEGWSLGVMDDESGKSMELMENVPLTGLSEIHSHQLCLSAPSIEKSKIILRRYKQFFLRTSVRIWPKNLTLTRPTIKTVCIIICLYEGPRKLHASA